MSNYKIHPLAMLFPEMSQKDFDELKESIRTLGLQEPIITDENSGMVIDGRNRLRACDELGIAPRFRSLSFASGNTIEDYIWTHNAVRRHLTDDQRAVLATQWLEALEKQARKRQGTPIAPPAEVVPGQMARKSSDDQHATRTAIAKRANVSTRKAREAITVKKHAPHLAPKVASGEMKLRDAAKQAKPAKPKAAKPTKPSKPSKPPKIDKHTDRSKAAPSPKDAADKVIENLIDSVRWTLDDGVSSTGVEAFKLLLADKLEQYAKMLRTNWNSTPRRSATPERKG